MKNSLPAFAAVLGFDLEATRMLPEGQTAVPMTHFLPISRTSSLLFGRVSAQITSVTHHNLPYSHP